MTRTRLLREERETIIRISEADSTWTVFSESQSFMRKLQRLGFSGTKDGEGMRYAIPRRLVSVRRPRKAMSEQEKAKFRDRFNKKEPVHD